jgi:hypothetical protein
MRGSYRPVGADDGSAAVVQEEVFQRELKDRKYWNQKGVRN